MQDSQLAAFYGRVSTDKQDTSLDTQDERVGPYAAQKRLTIRDDLRFTDEDTSGSIPFRQRNGGKLLLNTIELYAKSPTPVRHLIVTKIDRLGRDSLDGELLMRRLRELSVTVHIIDLGGDSLSTAGFFGELIIKIIFAIAEWDRKNITQNIRTRMAHKREKGELCGTLPYGKVAIGTGQINPKTGKEIMRIEPCPDEIYWIMKMVTWRVLRWSYKRIADELNRLGVPTKVPKGTPICIGKDPATRQKIIQPHSGLWRSGNVAGVIENRYTQEMLAAPSKASQAA
jgi:putative DNA-invertase from lambdoid prophage Rac